MIRRPPRSTHCISSAASDVYKRQVKRVRDLMGPTDSRKAPKGTIRGDLGKDAMMNLIHGSDSPENAAIELKRFFSDSELFEEALKR